MMNGGILLLRFQFSTLAGEDRAIVSNSGMVNTFLGLIPRGIWFRYQFSRYLIYFRLNAPHLTPRTPHVSRHMSRLQEKVRKN